MATKFCKFAASFVVDLCLFSQAAHVGVGISGVEGLQAASASDYAIAQVTHC